MISLSDIPLGSALSILGTNDAGAEETWYGQVNAKKDGKMEVALLQAQDDGSYVFEQGGYTPHYFEVSCVQQYEPIPRMDCMKAHEQAWGKWGLRWHTDDEGVEVFLPLDAGTDSDESAYTASSESDSESVGSLDGFIVDDDDGEAFTLAENHDAWVEETHQAVEAFNEWVPPPALKKVKTFIEKLEQKYVHKDDNKHFEKGRAAPNYTHPPCKKKAKYK